MKKISRIVLNSIVVYGEGERIEGRYGHITKNDHYNKI